MIKAKKAKHKSMAKLVDDAATLLQKLVRMKAADSNGMCRCITCRKVQHWKEMQGGHFIERNRLATKLLEENVNPQCPYCNQWGMKQASCVLRYRQAMVELHGEEFVRTLERDSKATVKRTRGEVEDLILDFKARIKEQETRLNGMEA